VNQQVSKWLVTACLGWLLLLTAAPLMAQPARQQQQLEFVLQRLAISPAIAQLDTVIAQTLQNLQQRPELGLLPAQLERIGDVLSSHCAANLIQLATERGLIAELPGNNEQLMSLLADQLFDRVANFDVSLQMRDAEQKFARFQQQRVAEEQPAERLALLQRLDAALQSSAIAAMLQTELAVTADMMAARYIAQAAVSDDELARRRHQRQRHLAKVLLSLNLYSYRFMPDQELQRYVGLLEQDRIQTLLIASKQALYQALLAARAAALEQLAER
jgi:hypothetical protein